MTDIIDSNYLSAAQTMTRYSPDPSTKVGAVIRCEEAAIGAWNDFPNGVESTPERWSNRELKYKLVVHAEARALLAAGEEARGAILYSTLYPCSNCAKLIAAAGVSRVVCPAPDREDPKREPLEWGITDLIFREAKVRVDHIELAGL